MGVKESWYEPEIVTRKGNPVSVILPIADFEELLERVEDTIEVARLNKAHKKPIHCRPWKGYLSEQGMESKSKRFGEQGAEVCTKA